MADDGRPQDQGRRHRRAGKPSAETTTLLVRYQAAMRAELSALLADIAGRMPDHGLLGAAPGEDIQPVRPALKDRAPMWDLAVKLARELGTEVDPAGGVGGDTTPAAAAKPRKWARSRIDFGGG
jgi:hypothetical protein